MNHRNESKVAGHNEDISSRRRFERVYLDCYDALKAVIARYLKRPEDIEDIVQETFIRTYEARQHSKISNLQGYFFATARNLSLKHKALHAHKITDCLADLGIAEVLDDRPSLESEIESREQFSIFCEALRQLPVQCRRVLILKKICGLSHEEVAKKLHITVSTTNQHLAKGIARCALYMHERGYIEDAGKIKKEKRTDGAAK